VFSGSFLEERRNVERREGLIASGQNQRTRSFWKTFFYVKKLWFSDQILCNELRGKQRGSNPCQTQLQPKKALF